jgi:hypothetical protein
MKRLQTLIAVGLVLLMAASAQARATYKGKMQMIDTAEAIAVVTITSSTKVTAKGKLWDYRQKASARVESVLKGRLPGRVSLYGDEDFPCARSHFAPGRYLVFLHHDNNLWTGNNWYLSAWKINKDKVEWFADDKTSYGRMNARLADVIKGIRHRIASHKQ